MPNRYIGKRPFMVLLCLLFVSFYTKGQNKVQTAISFDFNKEIERAGKLFTSSLPSLKDSCRYPRNVEKGETEWKTSSRTNWTPGFYPGSLWYMYKITGNEFYKSQALRWLPCLKNSKEDRWSHDLGFQFMPSYGQAFEQTKNKSYKAVVIDAAASLASLYNNKVGTTKSWTWRKNWMHPTIIDNMLNLELLFWAGQNGGDPKWFQMATMHAEKTRLNHLRPDFSSYHVVNYDTATGKPLAQVTDQGYCDSCTWSRGQAWGIYGFAMAYRYTQNESFLNTSLKMADWFTAQLPESGIPYWDFNAPNIPNEEPDASAAAVFASAMFDLAKTAPNQGSKKLCLKRGITMLNNLEKHCSSANTGNPALLIHSTGSKPHKSEIDVSLVYADYYYLEALYRYKLLEPEIKRLFAKP